MDDPTPSFTVPPPHAAQPLASALAALTAREREVLQRLTVLTRPPDIARDLGIGEPTVRTHIANARRKLGGITALAAARALAESEGRHQDLPNHLLPMAPPASDWRRLLPVRRKGAHGNDLDIGVRLIWIVLLTIGLAVGFGMLAVGGRVVSDLVRAVQ